MKLRIYETEENGLGLVKEKFENLDIVNDPKLNKYLRDYVDHVVMFGGQIEVEDQIYRDFSDNPAIASKVVKQFRKLLADYKSQQSTGIGVESYKRLREQNDNKIEVKHSGILEVPEGKNVDDLPMSHFEKLVKKNGLSKITRALNNLQVWNKNDDKALSKWAGNMIDKLKKKFDKDESLSEGIEADDYQDMCNKIYDLMEKNHISGEVLDCGDGYAEIQVNWGDWKHSHLRLDYLMKQAFDVLHNTEEVTESNGSDTYSAIHRYIIKNY